MSFINLIDDFSNLVSLKNTDPFAYVATQACPVLNTPVDWKETQESHIFTADLPGVSTEGVAVQVLPEEDGSKVLQISGDRGGDADGGNKDESWRRVERPRGKFVRRFRLPENARTDDGVRACMEDGVLKVVVGKREVKNEVQRKVIQIEGS